jgi:hypothetical protein
MGVPRTPNVREALKRRLAGCAASTFTNDSFDAVLEEVIAAS